MRANRRTILTAIGAVLVVILGTIVLERLFRNSSREWATAVQAMLGIIIAIATVVYATLTHQLVDVARRSPREAAERDTAAAVASAITANSFKLSAVRDRFPIDLSGGVPTEPLFPQQEVQDVRSLADQIDIRSVELPESLVTPALTATKRLLMLQTGVLCFMTACAMETRAGETAGTPVTWRSVKGRYYTDIRDERFSVEWDVLTSGRLAEDADRALDQLHDAIVDYMSDTGTTERAAKRSTKPRSLR
jgi:hypothetical protein